MTEIVLADAIRLIEPGMTVFIHGTATEPRALALALSEAPHVLDDVHVITSFIPGINTVDLAGLGARQRYTSFMASAPARDARGPREALRLPYSELPTYLARLTRLDLAFVQGRRCGDGRVMTGITGELIPAAVARADLYCLIDNSAMPLPAVGVELSAPDFVITSSEPLVEYLPGQRTDEISRQIAERVAAIVPDGATLQAGLGVIPNAIFSELRQRQGLRVMSGMISDSIMSLHGAGALDAHHEHVYGMAMGSRVLYEWLDGREGFRVAHCGETHDRRRLAAIPKFFAMNSALEVALDGSVNAEQLGSRVVSGPGGLPDYAFGGASSTGGASIIALPSANHKRGISRIVSRLANQDSPTLPAGAVTHVVTEYGVADLRCDDPDECRRRMIAVAHPDYRDTLGS